jgi:4-hydroxybenzoyl-CoA thioesterase
MSRPRPTPVAASDLPPSAFRTERRIRFSDCDPAGIAYTPRIVDLMNGAIEDAFPGRLGQDYHAWIRDQRVGLGYARADCDFLRPFSMGDEIVITVLIAAIGGASATWRLHLHRGEDEVARGELVMVTTDLDRHRVIPVPPILREAFRAYQADCA